VACVYGPCPEPDQFVPLQVVAPPLSTSSVPKLDVLLPLLTVRLLFWVSTVATGVPVEVWTWKAALEFVAVAAIMPVVELPAALKVIPPTPFPPWIVVCELLLLLPTTVLCALAAVPRLRVCPLALSMLTVDAAVKLKVATPT
jgi:hypothetical protein